MEGLASVVVAVHVFWVVLLIGGTVVAARLPSYRPIHAAIFALTVTLQMALSACPLTMIERSLRSRGGAEAQVWEGGFIRHYLAQWFGLAPPPDAIKVTQILLFAVSMALLVAWFRGRRLALTSRPPKLTPGPFPKGRGRLGGSQGGSATHDTSMNAPGIWPV